MFASWRLHEHRTEQNNNIFWIRKRIYLQPRGTKPVAQGLITDGPKNLESVMTRVLSIEIDKLA